MVAGEVARRVANIADFNPVGPLSKPVQEASAVCRQKLIDNELRGENLARFQLLEMSLEARTALSAARPS
jgi:hypothetical protein